MLEAMRTTIRSWIEVTTASRFNRHGAPRFENHFGFASSKEGLQGDRLWVRFQETREGQIGMPVNSRNSSEPRAPKSHNR